MALTESEIFSFLTDRFNSAALHAELLAKLPAQGPTYTKLRDELKELENACRQAGHWREDSRWFRIGMLLEEAHQRSLNWLRYHHPRPLFLKLADNLRGLEKVAERLRDAKVEHVGAILPTEAPGPHRDTRPVQIILPEEKSHD